MKQLFRPGEKKFYQTEVTPDKTASFDSGEVHPFYSTFALARDAEWACRMFVLDMKEEGEEGIGISLSIEHLAPALVGATVTIIATLEELIGNKVVCSFRVMEGQRLLATGNQSQKILSKEKLSRLMTTLR